MATRNSEEMEGNIMQLLLLHAEDCVSLKRRVEEKKYLSG